MSFIRPSRFSLKRLSVKKTAFAAFFAGFRLSASGIKPRTALNPPNADKSSAVFLF